MRRGKDVVHTGLKARTGEETAARVCTGSGVHGELEAGAWGAGVGVFVAQCMAWVELTAWARGAGVIFLLADVVGAGTGIAAGVRASVIVVPIGAGDISSADADAGARSAGGFVAHFIPNRSVAEIVACTSGAVIAVAFLRSLAVVVPPGAAFCKPRVVPMTESVRSVLICVPGGFVWEVGVMGLDRWVHDLWP